MTKAEINARATAYFADPLVESVAQEDKKEGKQSVWALLVVIAVFMWWFSSIPFVAAIAVFGAIYNFIRTKTNQFRERPQTQSASRVQGRR